MADTDWIQPGAQVIIEAGGYSRQTMTPATVERLTKLHAVVDGRKFRLSDGREVGKGSAWTLAPRLLNPRDPRVRQDLAEQRASDARRGAQRRVAELLTKWRRDDDDGAAREALIVLVEALAEVEGLSS